MARRRSIPPQVRAAQKYVNIVYFSGVGILTGALAPVVNKSVNAVCV
jgi:hypothetical protein